LVPTLTDNKFTKITQYKKHNRFTFFSKMRPISPRLLSQDEILFCGHGPMACDCRHFCRSFIIFWSL